MANHTTITRWRCRRGMKELDLMLLPFHDECYAELEPKQCDIFNRLLEATDPELFSWCMGHETSTDNDFQQMVELIREYSHRTEAV